MRYTSLPTWLLNHLTPKGHPFNGLSLETWHRGQTPLAHCFDGALWFSLTLVLIVLL